MNAWLLDAGNTRLKLARCCADSWEIVEVYPAVIASVSRLLARVGEDQTLYVSSVSPPELREALLMGARALGVDVRLLSGQRRWGRLRCGYEDCHQFGVDRWAAMIGAYRDSPYVVLDAGSAVTIDVVDAQSEHRGGLILPGIQVALMGLRTISPKLTGHVEPVQGLPRCTADAVGTGVVATVVGALAWSMQRVGLRPESTVVIVSGGDGPVLQPFLEDYQVEMRANAVLDGLHVWACAEILSTHYALG